MTEISKTKLVIFLEAANLIPIFLDTNIILESEKSHTVTAATLKAVEMGEIFLTQWMQTNKRMLGTTHNMLSADQLLLVKLAAHGIITTDAFNSAKMMN